MKESLREQAAIVCSMAASDTSPDGVTLDDYGSSDAVDLAWRTLSEAAKRLPTCHGRALWGEAECLLRTGEYP